MFCTTDLITMKTYVNISDNHGVWKAKRICISNKNTTIEPTFALIIYDFSIHILTVETFLFNYSLIIGNILNHITDFTVRYSILF